MAQVFDSRAAAAAAVITGDNYIITGGYASAGDGGAATYCKAGGSTTGGFQSADGAWWAIATADVNVCMFGAVSGVGNAAATTTAFSNAVTLQTSRGGGRIFIPQGNYFLNSTITLPTVTASIELIGESEESTAISANGNIVLFKVQAAYSVIRNLTLVGYNNVAAGAPTLWLATGTSGDRQPGRALLDLLRPLRHLHRHRRRHSRGPVRHPDVPGFRVHRERQHPSAGVAGISIGSSCDHFTVTNNLVGTCSTPVSNSSGTGATKVVASNV